MYLGTVLIYRHVKKIPTPRHALSSRFVERNGKVGAKNKNNFRW